MIATLLFLVAGIFLAALFARMILLDGARIRAALDGRSPAAFDMRAPVQVKLRWVKPAPVRATMPEWRAAA